MNGLKSRCIYVQNIHMTWFRRKRKIEKITIFYCWQSDIPGQREMIENELKAQALILQEEYGCAIILDRDDYGNAGMSSVSDKLLEKIRNADLFVCDITPVTKFKKQKGKGKKTREKLMPNSNVMFELGYALRCIHPSRIIALANMDGDSWHPGEMPFDIYHRKYVEFTSQKDLRLGHALRMSINEFREKPDFQAISKSWYEKLTNFLSRDNNAKKSDLDIDKEQALMSNPDEFFAYRLSKAFPGVVGEREYSGKDAIRRLKILLQDPIRADKCPLAIEDGFETFAIDAVREIRNGEFLIGENEVHVLSLKVYRDVTSGKSSYVEIESLGNSYIDQSYLFDDNTLLFSGDIEEYAVFYDDKGVEHVISRQLYNDKVAFTRDGKQVSLVGRVEKRRAHHGEFTIKIVSNK